MARLSQIEILDGFGESTESIGLAIGAANSELETKMTDKLNREVISSSTAICYNGTSYTAYITLIVSSYDLIN